MTDEHLDVLRAVRDLGPDVGAYEAAERACHPVDDVRADLDALTRGGLLEVDRMPTGSACWTITEPGLHELAGLEPSAPLPPESLL